MDSADEIIDLLTATVPQPTTRETSMAKRKFRVVGQVTTSFEYIIEADDAVEATSRVMRMPSHDLLDADGFTAMSVGHVATGAARVETEYEVSGTAELPFTITIKADSEHDAKRKLRTMSFTEINRLGNVDEDSPEINDGSIEVEPC